MITIRQAQTEDAVCLAKLEQIVFSDAWSETALVETLRQDRAYIFLAEEKNEVVGWLTFYSVLDEGEIARIAVIPSKRNAGVAGQLLEHLQKHCVESGIGTIFLEVRASNLPARTCYRKHGFLEDGIRKQYYSNPEEDAVLMHREFP